MPTAEDRIAASWPLDITDLPFAYRKATKPVTAHMKGFHNQEDHAGGSVPGQARSESRRRLRREFVQANDPLGAMAWHLAELAADDFVGSGRVGGDGEVGVDLVGTMDDDGFRSLRVGVGARTDNALEADEVAVLADAQISKLHDTLTSATRAATTGRAFDGVVDGEDNADLHVTVDEGGRDVRVSAHSWAAQEAGSQDWDPVLEKDHILGRWPTRNDFASGTDFDRYLEYGGFDSEDHYLDFTQKSPYEPDTPDEMAPTLGPSAVLTPAQAGELVAVIERLQLGRPWREERSGITTAAETEVKAASVPVTAHLKGRHNQQDHAGIDMPDIDLPDVDSEGEDDEEPGEFDDINSQLPESYLNTYGPVISSSNITGEFELIDDDPYAIKDETRVDATVTEKGGFHIAQGVKDRKVVQQLDMASAAAISDLMWDIEEGKTEVPFSDPHTGVSVAETPGGYRVTWASGTSTDMDADRLTDISEALNGVADNYREEFGGKAPVRAARRKEVDHDQLHEYWTKGEGLARWATSNHPWTELMQHLSKHVGHARAKRIATDWYIEVFGYASGSDKARVAHGKPPRGDVIGPG